jgi:hypothetical protein
VFLVNVGMHLLILRLAISSRCATKLRRKHFAQKRDSIHLLEAALPGIYLPLYTMVTFTRIPYAVAAKRARVQDFLVYTSSTLMVAILIGATFWFVGR